MGIAERVAEELVEVRPWEQGSLLHALFVAGEQASEWTDAAPILYGFARRVRPALADAVRRAIHEDRSAGVQGGLLAPEALAAAERRGWGRAKEACVEAARMEQDIVMAEEEPRPAEDWVAAVVKAIEGVKP